MIILAHGCRNVKTGPDWTEIDYCPVQKCLAKLYSFLPFSLLSGLIGIQCIRTYIGWLFQSQPTSSRVRDKYCLRSSTFHARLPPPVPWPAKSEGWNNCQMPSPVSFQDDWKEVLSWAVFKAFLLREHRNKLWSRILKWWCQHSFKKGNATLFVFLSINCRGFCVF